MYSFFILPFESDILFHSLHHSCAMGLLVKRCARPQISGNSDKAASRTTNSFLLETARALVLLQIVDVAHFQYEMVYIKVDLSVDFAYIVPSIHDNAIKKLFRYFRANG